MLSWETVEPPLDSLTRGVYVSWSLFVVVTVLRIGTEAIQNVVNYDKKGVSIGVVGVISLCDHTHCYPSTYPFKKALVLMSRMNEP